MGGDEGGEEEEEGSLPLAASLASHCWACALTDNRSL